MVGIPKQIIVRFMEALSPPPERRIRDGRGDVFPVEKHLRSESGGHAFTGFEFVAMGRFDDHAISLALFALRAGDFN
ncbi:hypothetical protein SDC9_190781 [bioreactor metagenome]|uniref:Uncharacterized protein n=1 Tax=bioreactor metagenome TaxID=1076179 RepID=A0A645HXI7_9ZZZZ